MHVYTVYVRIYGTPTLWSFLGGWGGCDRDEGHDGFLTGGGVSMGRRPDVTVFVK